MSIVRKHLSQPWFDLIRTGRKTHEGRINEGFWKNLEVSDVFYFFNDENSFLVKVIEKILYPSFKDGIENLGLENVLPSCFDNKLTIDQSIDEVYYKYFSQDQEIQHGIVFFKFDVL